MRLGSVTNCLFDAPMLDKCLGLLPFDMEKVVVISDHNYNNELVGFDTESANVALKHKAQVFRTSCGNQSDMRNLGLALLQGLGVDYALIIDADEWYPHGSVEKLRAFMEAHPADAYRVKMKNMFKERTWYVESPGDRGTIIALKTSCRFDPTVRRDYGGHEELVPDIDIYHMSYAREPKAILRKLSNFSHRHEVVRDWYEKVFLPATPESKNVHPTTPNAWPRIQVVPLPEELL